jgi:hypothetical protein
VQDFKAVGLDFQKHTKFLKINIILVEDMLLASFSDQMKISGLSKENLRR